MINMIIIHLIENTLVFSHQSRKCNGVNNTKLFCAIKNGNQHAYRRKYLQSAIIRNKTIQDFRQRMNLHVVKHFIMHFFYIVFTMRYLSVSDIRIFMDYDNITHKNYIYLTL